MRHALEVPHDSTVYPIMHFQNSYWEYLCSCAQFVFTAFHNSAALYAQEMETSIILPTNRLI